MRVARPRAVWGATVPRLGRLGERLPDGLAVPLATERHHAAAPQLQLAADASGGVQDVIVLGRCRPINGLTHKLDGLLAARQASMS